MPRPAASGDQFRAPTKAIQDADDLKKFLSGETVKDFVAFILSLNQAAIGESEVVLVLADTMVLLWCMWLYLHCSLPATT